MWRYRQNKNKNAKALKLHSVILLFFLPSNLTTVNVKNGSVAEITKLGSYKCATSGSGGHFEFLDLNRFWPEVKLQR